MLAVTVISSPQWLSAEELSSAGSQATAMAHMCQGLKECEKCTWKGTVGSVVLCSGKYHTSKVRLWLFFMVKTKLSFCFLLYLA